MKNKSDLKRKVLCSLLAASTMGIFYSSDALAASVNGVNPDLNNDGIITDAELIGLKDSEGNNVGSHHFIIGQGDKITVATDGNVNQLLEGIKAIKNDPNITDKLGAVRQLLAEHVNVGVVGGEGQLDSGLKGFMENIRDGEITTQPFMKLIIDNMVGFDVSGTAGKIANIDTIKDQNIDGDTNLIIGGVENEAGKIVSPVVIGAVGGDLSVNTGLNGSFHVDTGDDPNSLLQEGTFTSSDTSIERNGNVNIRVDTGNVLGGVGGSAAITVGNISFDLPEGKIAGLINANANLKFDGKTTTTIDGDVNTWINNGANVGGFANSGAAMAIGGEANSIVKGDSSLVIDSVVDMDGAVDGVVAGASGGGLAVTTIGGTANSIVEGDSNIRINNGLAGGIIGGGIAVSVDATGVAEGLIDPSKQYGNDAGYVDITGEQLEDLLGMSVPDNITITVDNAVQGGEATANVNGNVNINLTGTTTGVGIVGGGVAAATHTYTWKGDGTAEGDYAINDEYGKSVATAETGKVTIKVELDSTNLDKVKFAGAVGGMKDAVSQIIAGNETAGIEAAKDALKDAAGQGAVAGVFGGGAALAHSGNRNNIDDSGLNDQGAFAVANTAGADINLISGYAAGVFGGGAAMAINNSSAASNMTDTVNINIYKDMEAVGVFGNGFAYYTGSYKTSTGENANLEGTANVTAQDTNINVAGMVDGIVNGGLAIDDSEADTTNAMVRTENGTINVFDGATVNVLDFNGFTGMVGNAPDDSIDMASYVAGIADAAKTVAIAAGGAAVGGGAESTVANAEVNIYGGTVNGDVIGGGVAAYGFAENDGAANGAHVDKSTLNLYGGTIDGNVYAGGSASDLTKGGSGYDQAKATVGNSTINLAGTEVTGVISGKGVHGNDDAYQDNEKVENSTLNLIGENTLSLVDNNGSKESKVTGFNNVNAEAGSVTKVEGLDSKTALIDAAGTQVTVDGSAKLDINALAADGTVYKVISNTDAYDAAWTNANMLYDRTKGYAAGSNVANGSYDITYKDLADLTEEEQDKAVNDFKDSLGEGGDNFEGTANGIIRNGENTNAGAKDFFGDYTKGEGTSRDLAAMAMIGEAAGVTSNTIDVAGDMADNSVLRLSFTQDNITGEPEVNEDGAIWAKYIHNKHDLDGMASSFGSVDSSSDFDGATIGVDFAKKGKVQSGIAFSYGSGDSHGMGINNDFDMWGVSLYGNVKNDDTNVIADIGFSESDNELTGTAMGKDIKADRDVSVFTVGVRAEKLYTNGSTQIVPYTGLRYYNVDPDSYTAYYDGQKFGEYDADRQNIWTLPVGVSLRNETVTESGWRLTPKVDVAYIWAFGDTDNSFDLNTGSGVDTLDYTVMDSGSWLGSVGFEAGKDDWAFGVGYSYQKGSHEEANKWFVNVEYSF